MPNKTKIEWVKNPNGTPGYTWNPITGCLNGCNYCYARKLANTRLKERYLANPNLGPVEQRQSGIRMHSAKELLDPFYPRFWPEKISGELNKRSCTRGVKARGIFVCNMSDLFGIGIPEDWTRQVLDKIRMRSYHRFYLLTKQPQNLQKFSPFTNNCWVGVSATDYTMNIQALRRLSQIEAKVKYVSYEPLLGQLIILPEDLKMAGISWVILGSQTKPYKPPKIEWVKEIVEACDKAGVKVFLKDSLKPFIKAERTDDWYCLFRKGEGRRIYPVELRQELPNV